MYLCLKIKPYTDPFFPCLYPYLYVYFFTTPLDQQFYPSIYFHVLFLICHCPGGLIVFYSVRLEKVIILPGTNSLGFPPSWQGPAPIFGFFMTFALTFAAFGRWPH
jgi:hypothetical protein